MMTEPRVEAPRKRVLYADRLYDHIDFHPHPDQHSFLSRREQFNVVCAGRRWGKSRSGPMKILPKIFLKKPTRGWIVAPTYDLGEKEFRVFWKTLVDDLKVPTVKGKTFYSIRTKDFRIETEWGTVIEVRSAEHPESLVGEGLDWVIMAEAAKLKLSHWEKYIAPTLADNKGSAIFVSTPEGYNWFYDLYMRGQSRDDPEWWSLKSPSWRNTIIFPTGLQDPFLQERLRNSSPEVFNQEWGADFTSFAGRIYSEFDEGYHVLQDYVFRPDWRNYLAFDFGFRNPFVCLNIQVDPEDNIYVWDEYYQRGETSTEHARRLKSIIQWRVDGGYYDPSGADQAGSMLHVFQDTAAYNNRFLSGVSLEPAPNDWESGITRVKEWLKLREGPNGTKPKLFISAECTETRREFNVYKVKEQTEKMKDTRDPKEEPQKKNDHAMDALRYFVAGHFGLASHYGYQE